MIQKLWVDGILPGENEIIAAAKKRNWRGIPKYAKMKRDATNDIFYQIKAAKLKPVAQAKFIFTWIEPNKCRDKDNIAAGKKFLFDALVEAGILKNDGWKEIICWEDHFYVAEKSGKTGVMVTIEEILPQEVAQDKYLEPNF